MQGQASVLQREPANPGTACIGVLALQGAYGAHEQALSLAGFNSKQVRRPLDLSGIDGLILPGGESTSQLKLLHKAELFEPIKQMVVDGMPTLGTCAGAILLAQAVRSPEQPSMGLIDIEVERNGYGRQLHSFEGTSDQNRALIMIRAPRIVRIGSEVTIVDTLNTEPILVRSENRWAATFHPELVPDTSLYQDIFGLKR